MEKENIIIKVGGSIISKSENTLFDFAAATNLKKLLDIYISNKKKFILCVGGGFIARKYQSLLRENEYLDEDLHKAGIAAINLNAVILQSVFKPYAEEKILRYEDFDEEKSLHLSKPILISAAGNPGHSSDWNAVKLAKLSNSKIIYSLKNVDGVYSADPKKDTNAIKYNKLSWEEYIEVIGNPKSFEPGGHYPVDIKAANLAKELDIKFIILDGNNLENLSLALSHKDFNGSIIG